MFSDLALRWRALFQRHRIEHAISDELQFHLDRQVEAYVAAGVGRSEAERLAQLEFGGLAQIQEDCRDALGIRLIQTIDRHLRYTLRTLRRSPTFTAVTIMTLAFGIGGTTAVFTIVRAVLLKPLPYGHANRLVEIAEAHPERGEMAVRAADFADWQRGIPSLDRTTGFFWYQPTLTGNDRPETVIGEQVLDNFFEVLGVSAQLGRTFTATDYRTDASPSIILSDTLWRRQFGADPSVVGRSLEIDSIPHVIVGIMSPEFWRPFGVEVWSAWRLTPAQWQDRRLHRLITLATLRPGVTIDHARTELAETYRTLARTYPDDREWSAHVRPYRATLVGDAGAMLRVLFGGVIAVLLIACASVAGLVLARFTHRERELAVRRALGATRNQLMALLLLEAALLAITGSGLGLLLAYSAMPWLSTLTATVFPAMRVVPAVDGSVLAFTASTATLVVFLCGLVPALGAGTSPVVTLPSVRASSGSTIVRARAMLIVIEIAGAVVLVTFAGLMADRFITLARARAAYDTARVLTASVRLPQARDGDNEAWLNFQRRAVEQLRTLPGVDAAAATDHTPGTEFAGNVNVTVTDATDPSFNTWSAKFLATSPMLFDVLGIPVVTGRAFSDADAATAPGVVIVNERVARRVWADQDAVGRVLHVESGLNKDFRVIGVVPDARIGPPPGEPASIIYFPFAQLPGPDLTFLVRAVSDVPVNAESIRRALNTLDPQVADVKIRALDDILADGRALPRAATWWSIAFSGFALLLASLGIYGLLAFHVSSRQHDIGIRIALGADRRAVTRLVLRQISTLTLVGLAAGTLAAVVVTRVLETVVLGTTVLDSIMVCAAIVVLLAVIAVASYGPTRRAIHLDPAQALRAA